MLGSQNLRQENIDEKFRDIDSLTATDPNLKVSVTQDNSLHHLYWKIFTDLNNMQQQLQRQYK